MIDVLRSGERIGPGGFILSANQRTLFVLQGDGNLVVYAADTAKPLWASRTDGAGVKSAIMQSDGNLVLLDGANRPVWSSATQGHPGAILHAQDDGNVVMLLPDGTPIWDTGTYGYNTTDSVRASKSFLDFFGSVESLGGGHIPGVLRSISDVTSDPKFLAAAVMAVAFAISGPAGAAAAGAAFASVAGAAIAAGTALQSGRPMPTAAMIQAGESVAAAGDFTMPDLDAADVGMPTVGELSGGLKVLEFGPVKALVTIGQAKIVDEAGNLIGGNPDAPVTVTFTRVPPAAPQSIASPGAGHTAVASDWLMNAVWGPDQPPAPPEVSGSDLMRMVWGDNPNPAPKRGDDTFKATPGAGSPVKANGSLLAFGVAAALLGLVLIARR